MTNDKITERTGRGSRRSRRVVRRLLSPIVGILAALYFVIDLLFLSILKPVAERLAAWNIFTRVAAWIRSLGPYPSLALFLVPLIMLEPVKPVAGYFIASGHIVYGIAVLTIGEILKITIVERLFHLSRDKLMMIPAFAWSYNYVMGWLGYFQAFPAWQAVMRRVGEIKAMARRAMDIIKDQARRWWRKWQVLRARR